MTHIYAGKLIIIGSDNGLSPGRRQAIIWTNAGILLIGPLGTNFSEILIVIQTFSFKKLHFKTSSANWRLFCLGPNELICINMKWIHKNCRRYRADTECGRADGQTEIVSISWRHYEKVYDSAMFWSVIFMAIQQIEILANMHRVICLHYKILVLLHHISTQAMICQGMYCRVLVTLSVKTNGVNSTFRMNPAPTTPSFSTQHLASMDWAKTTARDEKNLSFGIWCAFY